MVALGCVIRGDTIHFEIVSQLSAQGLMDLSVARALPIGNGIVTVNTLTQASPARALRSRTRAAMPPARRWRWSQLKRRLARGTVDTWRAQAANQDRKANKRGVGAACRRAGALSDGPRRHRLERYFGRVRSHWLDNEVEGAQYLPAEAAFFRDIVGGVVREQGTLDPQIDAALARGWPLKRIETVLRAVLRAGAYELARRRDVPARVVASEYVDVAAAFVDKDETGMVNAVLDQLARQLRGEEFDAEQD